MTIENLPGDHNWNSKRLIRGIEELWDRPARDEIARAGRVTDMGWLYSQNALRSTVRKSETKTCPLCGGLNYYKNVECLACGWRGAFEINQSAIDFHWQQIVERYEEVRIEHLVPCRAREIGDFGIPRRQGRWQRLRLAFHQVLQVLNERLHADSQPSHSNPLLPPK
jgi:hypothetical protein